MNRVGQWSSWIVVALGAMYAIALGAGIAAFGLSTPIADPILAVMEILTILSAVALTVMLASIAGLASTHRQIFASLALSFSTSFAGVTMVVHTIVLTAGRQTGAGILVWPSALYAAELAAWDLLLGVALVFASIALDSTAEMRSVRAGFLLSGVLCLLGLVGPLLGNMPLQRIGIAGYACVLPVTCVLLARRFAVRERSRLADAVTHGVE